MRNLLPIGFCLVLAGCGGPATEPEPTGESAEEGRASVFDPMTDTLDRAQAVDDVGKDRKKAMDEALEQAEDQAPE